MRLADFETHTLRLAAAVVRASRFCLYRVGQDLEPYAHLVLGGDTRWIGPYMREFRQIDPIHPRYFEHSTRSVFRGSDAVCPPEQIERYRRGFQMRIGVPYKAELFMRNPSGHIIAGLRVSRASEFGDFDAETIAKLEALQPILTAALHTALRDDGRLELYASLTEREREVLHWVAEGLSNKKIGARLDVAVPTVKSHVRNIFRTFGVTTRAQLMAELLRNRVI